MNDEVLRLMAHIDQTRSEVRTLLNDLDTAALTSVIKSCARNDFDNLDDATRLLIGMLAIVSIFDLIEKE